jgi:HSP20 family molecular chaperone IbpA
MSRPGPFGHPYLLGFEEVERMLDRLSKQAEAYPPCNIEELGEDRLRITLAVAGFSDEALSIVLSDRELSVRGERPQPEGDRTFLYKGIAARGFQRSFILAEGWEVEAARLLNGLLRIDLKRVRLAPDVRNIPITIG